MGGKTSKKKTSNSDIDHLKAPNTIDHIATKFIVKSNFQEKLKTLLDTIVKIQVPPGTQPDTLIACKGQGMPIHKTLNIRGNLYVKINIIIPELSQTDLEKIKDL